MAVGDTRSESAEVLDDTAQLTGVFLNARTEPDLPRGFNWATQKEAFCPRNLLVAPADTIESRADSLRKNVAIETGQSILRRFRDSKGLVFCHRGLYEQASGNIENSRGALESGTKKGFYLHELDAFIPAKLDQGFVAHDVASGRVSQKKGRWEDYPFHKILKTLLISRNVRDAFIEDPGAPDFASSYQITRDRVLGVLETFWEDLLGESGRTVQLDLREEDIAKAIPHYTYHISKAPRQFAEHQGVQEMPIYKIFRSTIWKGYSKHYKDFAELERAIRSRSVEQYGRDFFELRQLHLCPPLIMVFFRDSLVELAKNEELENPEWERDSYDHIYAVAMRSISSFVELDVGLGRHKYNFILEIGYTGLGLGYNIYTGKARNPLTGEPLTDDKVISDSRADRALIDVALFLRQTHSELLFSSCTRLPDAIMPKGRFKAQYKTVGLDPWPKGERGLDRELKAIHGGLYPQSDLVVADNPAAEIAARVWIDKKIGLDRELLLDGNVKDRWLPYYDWIASRGAETSHDDVEVDELVTAVRALNYNFFVNTIGRGPQMVTKPSYIRDVAAFLPWAKSKDDSSDDSSDDTSPLAFRVRTMGGFELDNPGEADRSLANIERTGPLKIRIGGRSVTITTRSEAELEIARRQACKAARDNRSDVLEQLVKKHNNLDLNISMGLYGTPLDRACSAGSLGTVKWLVDYGADLRDDSLASASENGYLDLVEYLMKEKGAQAYVGQKSWSPLEAACAGDGNDKARPDIVRALLQKLKTEGISEPAYSSEIKHALLAACARGRKAIVELLLEEEEVATLEVSRALTAACGCKEADEETTRDIIDLLLSRGAKVNHQVKSRIFVFSDFNDALEAACRVGHLSIVKLLLDRGAKVDVPNILANALLGDHFSVVELLIDRGADVNCRRGWCPNLLGLACEARQLPVIKLLLDKGAAVNFGLEQKPSSGKPWAPTAPGKWGRTCYSSHTAIAAACREPRVDVADLLLAKGAKVDFDLHKEALCTELFLRLKNAGGCGPPIESPTSSEAGQTGLKRGWWKGPRPVFSTIRMKSRSDTYATRLRESQKHKYPLFATNYMERREMRKIGRQSLNLEPLRSCGCLICLLDDRIRPEYKDGRRMVEGEGDPVSITLGLMGMESGPEHGNSIT
jgi:ankyrin repeat protein